MIASRETSLFGFAAMSERVDTEPALEGSETRAFPAGVESVIGGRYRVLRKLGEGGFAYVFEASHVELPDLHYAIKVLRGEHAGEAEVIRKFRHEAVLLSGLKCPQTVRVVAFGITGDTKGHHPHCLRALQPAQQHRLVAELPDDLCLARMLAAQHLDGVVKVRKLHMAGLEDVGKAAFAKLPQDTVAPADHRLHAGREGARLAPLQGGLCINAL